MMLSTAPEPDMGDTRIVSGWLRAHRTGYRALGWIAAVLGPVLVAYAFLDKGFAYLHVPGLPIYAGEIVVVVSLTAAFVGTGFVRQGLAHSSVAKLVVAFCAWGAIRTVPYIGKHGIDAIRDAALWYYSLLALVVSAIVICDPGLIRRWVEGYRRFVPWLLATGPLAMFLAKAAGSGLGPTVPGSTISVFDHKNGNIAVQATIALAFVWLVPGVFTRRSRVALTGLATLVVLVIATQNRGGFVAATLGIGIIWLFAARRGRMVFVMAGTTLLLFAVGWSLNVQVTGEQNRAVSPDQLIQNVTSIVGRSEPTAAGNLESNVDFRDQLWSAVLTKVEEEHRVLTGLGFGPNIATELGFRGEAAAQLRSPHNSHLDVFARMGLVGTLLWLVLWTTWYRTALRARLRLRALGRNLESGVVEVCLVGVTATLVNAYFDPTVESPQVALWLWTLVGIALGLAAVSRRSRSTQPEVGLRTPEGTTDGARPAATSR